MRIKPIGKVVIFLIIGVIAFFLIRRYMPAGKEDGTTVVNTTSDSSAATSNTEPAAKNTPSETTAKAEARTFNYTPEKPVDGVLKGVVEVGASGFNSFVINMDKSKRWEIVSKDFGESLAYEGLISTDDIRAGLKKYLVGMFQKGVGKNNMHFVISSGAQKVPKTAIIADELKKIGYVVNQVTADQEGKFALKATIDPNNATSFSPPTRVFAPRAAAFRWTF